MIWILYLCHLFCLGFSFFSIYWHNPPSTCCIQWDIVRATWYQDLPLVTCQVNSWQIFFSTRGCLSLWLRIMKLPIVTYSWFHILDTLSITSFNLFQYITVDGWDVDWKKWNKCWTIIFWYSYCRACCNLLDSIFCALCVVLQREYKFFTLLLEVHKVFINLWITYGATFW